MLAFLPAIAIAMLSLGAGAATYYAPPETGEMAVVFGPGAAEASVFEAIRAAGGRFAGSTRLGNIAVAYADDPGFAGRIRERGALLILSAAALCGTAPADESSS
jgi:hypothetical protein